MISVVIPVYKVEKYIEQCVNSILSQSYSDLEIILVDDGSPDGCPEICDYYSKLDKRVKVIHKKNGGLSDARNVGIDIAKGDEICFIDSDDFITNNMLERLLDIMTETGAEIVCCQSVRCEEDDSEDTFIFTNNNKISYNVYSNIEKMEQFLIGNTIGTVAWGKLYKRSLFSSIRYPIGRYHEDVYTTYKVVDVAQKIAVTDYYGYIYRKNGDSITGTKFSPKRFDGIEGKIEQANFVQMKYPALVGKAYAGIVYSCNTCLIAMARAHYNDKSLEKRLQFLYRKYGNYYCKENVSKLGKVVVLLAKVNVRLTEKLLSVVLK